MARKLTDESDSPAATALTLYTDGGSRGNPGPAAAGFVLQDAAGRMVHQAGRFIGRATNNVAEYQAVVFGLAEAASLGAAEVTVFSDSELMVRQLNGQYRVKNAGLKPLYTKACELMSQFDSVTIEHVRREKNTVADALVNDALDAKSDVGVAASDGSETPVAADWPPADFTAHCKADGCDECPGVMSAGAAWPFEGVTPSGLCVYAAAGILAAVTDAAPGSTRVTAGCAKPGCPAKFEVKIDGPAERPDW